MICLRNQAFNESKPNKCNLLAIFALNTSLLGQQINRNRGNSQAGDKIRGIRATWLPNQIFQEEAEYFNKVYCQWIQLRSQVPDMFLVFNIDGDGRRPVLFCFKGFIFFASFLKAFRVALVS